MSRSFVIEIIAIYWPILMLVILARRLERPWVIGGLLAILWQIAVLPWLNYLAQHMGWWGFGYSEYSLLGMPVSLYIGWVLMWGGVAVVALSRLSIWLVISISLMLDLLFMPLLVPCVSLGRDWLVGEGVLIIFGLIPGLLVAKWSAIRQYAGSRSFLICLSFIVTVLTILPIAGDGFEFLWNRWLALENWRYGLAIVVFFLGLPSIAGAVEFARVGKGTPIPYDPPRSLVQSGVYSYIANPMQVSMIYVLVLLGVVFSSMTFGGLGIAAILYSAGFARWSESEDLEYRFGKAWGDYDKVVKGWKFRLLPSISEEKAALYLDAECVACSSIARWFFSREPRGLLLRKASDYPDSELDRVTYSYGGHELEVKGVEAIACALQHIHLGWAIIGWCIQLPLVLPLIQLCIDLSGGGKKQSQLEAG